MMLKFFLQEVKGREGQDSERRIICYPGEFEDTKFIRELEENETILLPPKSRLKTLSREELAFLYHRYTPLQNFQGWSKPIKRQKSRRQNYVCKFSKNFQYKLYYIEKSKTRGQTL